jgi:hypothetical protein
MQSRTDFGLEIETGNSRKRHLNSLELYEEFKHKDVSGTTCIRQKNFSRAGCAEKRKLEVQVDNETRRFRSWLVETKNLDDEIARYCSLSIRSLILGMPMGEQIAQFFDLIINRGR